MKRTRQRIEGILQKHKREERKNRVSLRGNGSQLGSDPFHLVQS